MGRLQRLAGTCIILYYFIFHKSVNGQAIYDEETETEHRIMNLASRVMERSTNKMAEELKDMKTKIENVLKMEQAITNLSLLVENNLAMNENILHDVRNLTLFLTEKLSAKGVDCADILKKYPETRGKDGVYTIITSMDFNIKKQAYCDMSTDNGGWTVIQRRVDGSVDFYRNWTEYREGFGSPYSEYWIGNEILHRLTSQRNTELRVDMQRFNGEKAYAVYSNFSVGDEDSKYQLTVEGYSGNAGDSFAYSNKTKFSTLDKDNDNSTNSCSTYWKTAGWFKNCFKTNPNGQYTDSEKEGPKYVTWYHWKKSYLALKNIQLMIRP